MISHPFLLQLEDVVRVLLKSLKIECGGIDFDNLLQWYPPWSPQRVQEGVTSTLQLPKELPSLDHDRAEEISSILQECPPVATSPLHDDTGEITSFSSGEDMYIPIVHGVLQRRSYDANIWFACTIPRHDNGGGICRVRYRC